MDSARRYYPKQSKLLKPLLEKKKAQASEVELSLPYPTKGADKSAQLSDEKKEDDISYTAPELTQSVRSSDEKRQTSDKRKDAIPDSTPSITFSLGSPVSKESAQVGDIKQQTKDKEVDDIPSWASFAMSLMPKKKPKTKLDVVMEKLITTKNYPQQMEITSKQHSSLLIASHKWMTDIKKVMSEFYPDAYPEKDSYFELEDEAEQERKRTRAKPYDFVEHQLQTIHDSISVYSRTLGAMNSNNYQTYNFGIRDTLELYLQIRFAINAIIPQLPKGLLARYCSSYHPGFPAKKELEKVRAKLEEIFPRLPKLTYEIFEPVKPGHMIIADVTMKMNLP